MGKGGSKGAAAEGGGFGVLGGRGGGVAITGGTA